MPGPIRSRLQRATWKEWGFDLSLEEVAEVEDFFSRWRPVYNERGAYRSQDALFASFNGLLKLMGHTVEGKERRNAVSVIRAGYCVALVEQKSGLRESPDEHLAALLRVMDQDAPSRQTGEIAMAHAAGHRLADVAWTMTVDKPQIGRGLVGFRLREAVFEELRHTLFVKLRLASWPPYLDAHHAELAMRFGHAVGVAEEAIPRTLPPPADSP